MEHQFEKVNCIICGQDNTEVFFQRAGLPQVVRCLNDGLVYLNPFPRLTKVRQFHAQYVREHNVDSFTLARQDVLRREAKAILRIKGGGNLLDVGCASGVFFENFSQPAWHLYGVETARLGADIARERFGAEVFNGSLEEAAYPGEVFDVVTVFDALYYFPDPRGSLKEIWRVLKDDGLLAVEIPGLTYRLFRERGPLCWLLDRKWVRGFADSWHLYYFSASTLELLLKAAGFHIIKVIPEQASLGRRGAVRVVNNLHFALARLLFAVTTGRFSIAGKELYLATKVRSN